MQLFNKKLPAWALLAALVIVGAGAATGLVLKDRIDGTTTIAISQALYVGTPTATGDFDEFLVTVNDDGMSWSAHFEANNGDTLVLHIPVYNDGGAADQDEIVFKIVMGWPEGVTLDMSADDTLADDGDTTTNEQIIQICPADWKSVVGDDEDNTLDITIAIEDAAAIGFYEITGTIYPLNV